MSGKTDKTDIAIDANPLPGLGQNLVSQTRKRHYVSNTERLLDLGVHLHHATIADN